MRRMRFGMIGLAAALAGCAPDYLPVDAAGHRTAMAPASAPLAAPAEQPQAAAPAQLATAATPAPSPPPVSNDTCGANTLAYLIGKPKTEIPIATDLSRRRVVCTTCMRTQDYRPDRLTILFDQQTGIVKGLSCG